MLKQAPVRVRRRRRYKLASERFVDVGTTRVRYVEGGAEHGGVPVLLIHGFQTGADYFFPHPFPAFAGSHRVIAPDLPGFAYSGRLNAYGVADYARFIAEFLDALSIEKVNIVGHSMGGQIAIGVAAQYPDRLNKLVLVDSAGLPVHGPSWHAPVRMLSDASARHVGIYPTMVRLGYRSKALRQALRMLRHDPITDLLHEIAAPTLIVWGSRDRVVPLEHGGFMRKHIPNARLAIVRGAGHMPFYQKPEEFNRIVLSFLREPASGTPDKPVD